MSHGPNHIGDGENLHVFKESLNRLMEEELSELKMHGNEECIRQKLSKHVPSVLPLVPAFEHQHRQATLPEKPLV